SQWIALEKNIPRHNYSFVDYLFYRNESFICGVSLFGVDDLNKNITIDLAHAIVFNVTEELNSDICH
ncbi:MAG: hypothetical protein V1659_05775, partial [Candidatus Woesearchaeota archaeon]